MVGLAFMSSATVLPAFAESLGASTVLIGAIPAVMTVGWFLPPLFAAAHTERLPVKLPFVLRWTGWERVPFLVLTLVAFFLADRAPALSIWVMLAMLLVMTAVGGFLMPAWTDLVARTLPARLRGRFFGLASLAGTLGGIAGSALTAWVLDTLPSSTAYGVCFLAATVFIGLSWIALVVVREPPSTTAPAQADFWAHLGSVPALLRRDVNFTWYLGARALMFAAVTGSGFFTVYALRVLRAPQSDVGVFTALLLAGQMLGQLALGSVADRAGHRLVMIVAACAGLSMNVVALTASSLTVFSAVFALNGLLNAAIQVSAVNVLLEFAPTPQQNPTYVGIERTFLAPFGFALPLVGGLMIDAVGYAFVFGLSAAFSVACAAALFVVRDPRHRRSLSFGIGGVRDSPPNPL
ncbi:MAG: MFS transporter [Candidatus Rokubacteria bacterium]|nr:MFS transporter [Candidatus Rokubacteria bacterium]